MIPEAPDQGATLPGPSGGSRSPITANWFYDHSWQETDLGPVEAWEDQLKQSAKLLLASVHPMCLVWSPKRVLLFNEAFSHIIGDKYEKALGVPVEELWGPVWPLLGPMVEDMFSGRSGFFEEQPVPTLSSGFRETRYLSCSYSPILTLQDKVVGGLVIITDRTERVRNFENIVREHNNLHDMFEQAPGFIAIGAGPDHRFTFANAAYRRLVGQTDIIGRTVAEILPELVEQGVIEVLDEAYRSGEPFVGKALPMKIQRSGDAGWEEVFVDIVYQPIKDSDGRIIGIFAEGYEVSEEKKANEKIKSLQSQLIHMSRLSAMGTMASTLAHELNQPLTAAANYLTGVQRLLPAGSEGDGVVTAVTAAKDQIVRAGDIIRRVRDMVANRPPERKLIKLRPLFEDAISLARLGGAVGECPIEIDIGPRADRVHGDRVQIEQVLLNLLRNGAQAAGANGERRLNLIAAAEHGVVRITVRDNGSGFGNVHPEALFTAFAPSSEGLGVGLSICRTIVEAHGGHIAATNNQDGGASFSFTLPKSK